MGLQTLLNKKLAKHSCSIQHKAKLGYERRIGSKRVLMDSSTNPATLVNYDGMLINKMKIASLKKKNLVKNEQLT